LTTGKISNRLSIKSFIPRLFTTSNNNSFTSKSFKQATSPPVKVNPLPGTVKLLKVT